MMHDFYFKVVTDDGDLKSGILQASNIVDAEEKLLRQAGLTIVTLRHRLLFEIIIDYMITYVKSLYSKFYKFQRQDIVFFTRELIVFLETGVTLFTALERLQKFVKQKQAAVIIGAIKTNLVKGHSFSHSIQLATHSFPNTYLASVKAGEKSGKLIDMLKLNLSLLEWEDQTISKFKAAIRVPLLLIGLSFVAFYFLLVKLLPRMIPYFSRPGKEIPASTQAIINVQQFLFDYKLVFFYLIFIMGISYFVLSLSQKGRYFLDSLYFKIPVFGVSYYYYILMKFSNNLMILYKSGIRIVDALSMSQSLFSGGMYDYEVQQVCKHIANGALLSDAMSRSSFFPEFMVEMVRNAEYTGTLTRKMERLGFYYAHQLEMKSQMIVASVEPIYLIVMISYILIVAFGFYLPMVFASF